MFTESQRSLLVYCRVRLNFICLLSTCIPFTYRLFLSFQRFPYLSALFLSVGASIGSDRFCRYHYKLSDSTFALASTKFFYINHVDALLDRSSCSKKIQELYAIFKFAEIHLYSLHRSESELREFRNKLFIFIDVMILIWVVWNFWCGKHIMW